MEEKEIVKIFQDILEENKKQNMLIENTRLIVSLWVFFSIILPLIFYISIYIIYKIYPDAFVHILKTIF